MKKTCFFILLFISTLHNVLSQELKLSNHSEISIITVGPGELLYEAFGHSAIRVKDSVLGFDYIFNYGLFDFNIFSKKSHMNGKVTLRQDTGY